MPEFATARSLAIDADIEDRPMVNMRPNDVACLVNGGDVIQ
jgi:hypothetical protein